MLPEYAALFNTKVFETKILESIKMREAQVQRTSIFNWAPNSTTAADYNDFMEELLKGGLIDG